MSRIGIFGSYARGEQTEDSDVDLLVEFSAPVGWEFTDLKRRLEEILGVRVDLVTVPALRPEFRDDVLNEVVYA
jgi:predicted nucleotidyltransferase